MKLRNLTALYMTSPEWIELSTASRRIYLSGMKHLASMMDMDVNKINRPMVIDLRDRLYDKRATCRIVLAVLNNILKYGYDHGHSNHNHAGSMRHLPKQIAIPRWSDKECDLFMERSKPYLRRAFMLALYTGQRRCDLIRMKWDQYDGKCISVLQQKTKRVLKIPVHPRLKEELDLMKQEQVLIRLGRRKNVPSPYIIHNYYGQPWSANSLTGAIQYRAVQLGIMNRSLHGLRKTTAAKLAELGCSPNLVASITGHRSLKEVMNYTDEADQVRMAEEAIAKWAKEDASVSGNRQVGLNDISPPVV